MIAVAPQSKHTPEHGIGLEHSMMVIIASLVSNFRETPGDTVKPNGDRAVVGL
jgi:hypothetical protein